MTERFTKEVELDSRKRIPLAAFKSVKPGQRYRISEGPDGVLLAEPVVSVLKKDVPQVVTEYVACGKGICAGSDGHNGKCGF